MAEEASAIAGATQQSLAADGAIAFFSSNLFPLSLDADRAPQLKAVVRFLFSGERMNYEVAQDTPYV
jgi:hypothetical protein